MAKKRKHQTSLSTEPPDPKRQRSCVDLQNAYLNIPNPHNSSHALHSRLEPTSNQRTALPGLDDDDDDEADSDYETSAEAIAYLRSVRADEEDHRSQASLLPPVFHNRSAAETAALLHDLESEPSRGHYTDGAYIAAPAPPVLGPTRPCAAAESRMLDAQDVCHASLLRRFDALRLRLQRRPSATDVGGLDRVVNPFEIGEGDGGWRGVSRWRRVLLKEVPKMVQVAAMDGELVLKLLEVLRWLLTGRRLLGRGDSLVGTGREAEGPDGRGLGAWAWALLGRLGERGTLSSEEIAVVRGLGKRAVEIIRTWESTSDQSEDWLEDVGDSEEQEEDDAEWAEDILDEGEGNTSSEDGADEEEATAVIQTQPIADTDVVSAPAVTLEAAQASLLKRLPSLTPSANTFTTDDDVKHAAFATLNAIITIVGHCYGQRDLLEARNLLWEMKVADGEQDLLSSEHGDLVAGGT